MESQHRVEDETGERREERRGESRTRDGTRGDGPPARRGRERKRQLVLMVEDDPNELEMYGRILWYNGFDVLYARDGAEGLRFAREHEPDLVLLDLGLPTMDGLEVCRRLRKEGSGSSPAVVVLTGQAGARAHQARTAGCDRYIEKPQSPLRVLHEVEALIGRAPPGAEGTPPQVRSPHRSS